MNTDARPALRSLISEANKAIRTCERDVTPRTLSDVRVALRVIPCDSLALEVSEALMRAAHLVSEAVTSAEMGATIDVNAAVGAWSLDEEWPEPKPEDDPTIAEIITLTGMCRARFDALRHWDLAKTAWARAYRAGVTALRTLVDQLPHEEEANLHLCRSAVDVFVEAARRAVAYRALFEARQALIAAADDAGLFVIGGRQPAWNLEGRGWRRRIGSAEYRFEVTGSRPLEGAPGGLIFVTRVDLTSGQESPHRVMVRSPSGAHRHDEGATLACI
ncbi:MULTISPECIES: hypothetical protein [unclassified Streptomyces]|uniref:hypothetical protein n=1 Tax=unclassified Streptomyces TaxID=2593676 RepID=UPI003320BD96